MQFSNDFMNVAFLACLALCFSGVLLAQPPGGRATPEARSGRAVVARAPGNTDGASTPREDAAGPGADGPVVPATGHAEGKRSALVSALDALIKAADKNSDGRITREEAGHAPWFERADRDGDGVISAAELERARRYVSDRAGRADGARALPSSAPKITPAGAHTVTSGPELLKPGEAGIGRMVEDVVFRTLDGRELSLGSFKDRRALAIVMTGATCPVSKRYMPAVARLQKELSDQGVALLLVNALASENPADIQAQIAAAGVTAPYVHDREHQIAALLHARTTTEVFLLDATRTLVYRGALDDQYGANYSLEAPKHSYLRAAVAALLRGEKPAVEATVAPGCELDLTGAIPEKKAAPVTYHRDVARILEQNCVRCHRDGGIAPFALDELDAVRDRARVIRRVVSEGTMPPWFAAEEKDATRNPWANDCSLSPRDKADLLAWVESKDKPAGDPADAPLRRIFAPEWSIGVPDLVIPLSRPYAIPADGFMPYAHDVVQTELAEDRWVSAYEILPSERDVVHHVLVRVHEKGAALREGVEGAEGYWAVYVPGNGACVYPEGFARKIPAGARVSFQIHYTPSGKAKSERLKLGLVFAKTPPVHEVRTAPVSNRRLAIPPGAARHVEVHSQNVPFDMPVLGFMPHMHTRGAAFRYEATFPDGRTETLLDIPRYDFNWQLRYALKRPLLLPRGTSVKITAVFNNSAQNKANPDPTRLVKWGAQTADEMMIGYIEYFRPL